MQPTERWLPARPNQLSQLVQYHIMTQPVRVALDANWPTPPQPFRQIPTASPTKMKVRVSFCVDGIKRWLLGMR